MKTIIEQIEERIEQHRKGVDFYEEKIQILDEENKSIPMLRAQRGHILAAIEELEWIKKELLKDEKRQVIQEIDLEIIETMEGINHLPKDVSTPELLSEYTDEFRKIVMRLSVLQNQKRMIKQQPIPNYPKGTQGLAVVGEL